MLRLLCKIAKIIEYYQEERRLWDSRRYLWGAISINPLNWKRDDTYASADENLGSRFQYDEDDGSQLYKVTTPGVADAQVDTERGVVICTNKDLPFMKDVGNEQFATLFGPESYHNGDYLFYYVNIQENVANRIHNYLLRQEIEAD
ncbi:MAG: hypothetical protein IJV16_05970 [Lachnospiraceae bacterium]|nr:hypothetical protein [Lachnospiraceae bacterium]